jgi:hypothetical protein
VENPAVRLWGKGDKMMKVISEVSMFALHNHLLIFLAIFVFAAVWNFYVDNIRQNETDDDWYDAVLYYKMLKKHGSRHKDFVGSEIKIGKDKSRLVQKSDGTLVRVYKEQDENF